MESNHGGTRPGAGRPVSGRGAMLRMYANSGLLKRFDRIAASRDLTRTEMLRMIVTAWVKRQDIY